MSAPRPPGRGAALLFAAAVVTLGGCVSLLPKTPPVQLYTFLPPAGAADAQTPAPAQAKVGVVLSDVTLPTAAAGDGILTVTGQQAAYIAGARWMSPAALLFQQQAEEAFGRARAVRLLHRGEIGAARAVLRLDVLDFEARYETPGAAPTVLVTVQGTLTRADGHLLDQRAFAVRQPAADNRVSAIVSAYEQATGQVLSQIVGWTDGLAASAAAS